MANTDIINKFADKGLMPPPLPVKPAKRDFTAEEVIELQGMHQLVQSRKFEAAQVKANTALLPKTFFRSGKDIAREMEAIATLLENAKNLYVSEKLIECGYPAGEKCSINLGTGKITTHA